MSEVASNAVLHARTALTVETATDGSTWYVGVKDHSPVVPSTRSHAPDATSGRGLQLLEAIVDRWGTRVEPDGKVVWFELDLLPACL